jgi:hypothetical protein
MERRGEDDSQNLARRPIVGKLNPVQQMDVLVELAKDMGYEVRYEMLCGTGGGICEIGRRRCLFVDLSQNALDQLESISQTLSSDPQIALYIMSQQQEIALRGKHAA